MAKSRKGRRKMGRYIKGRIDSDTSLGTLAPGTAATTVLGSTVQERTLVSSIDCDYSLSNFTIAANVGPIEIGVAHGDYTLAEIQAWSDLSTGWDEGNKGSQEIAKRLIRTIGVFSGPEVTNAVSTFHEKVKLNWILNQGLSLQFWFKNNGSAAISSTDPNVNVQGHANLWPR